MKHRNFVIKTTVKNLDLKNTKPERAGIIIYTTVKKVLYFGLGLDSRTHDLTDFGGRIIYKIENVIEGAIREFKEETLGIFEDITYENIKDCPVIYDDKNLIIFVHIDINPNLICLTFNKKYNEIKSKDSYKHLEICAITWLSLKEFKLVIRKKGTLFSRLQNFLLKANNLFYLL